MKNTVLTLLGVIALSIAIASPVYAGGDQVRGENGQTQLNRQGSESYIAIASLCLY